MIPPPPPTRTLSLVVHPFCVHPYETADPDAEKIEKMEKKIQYFRFGYLFLKQILAESGTALSENSTKLGDGNVLERMTNDSNF